MICSEEDLPEQRILWEMNQWGVLAPWLHSWQRSQKHPRVVVGASRRKHPLFSVLFPSLCLSVQRQWSRHMRNSKAGWSCQAKGFIMIHFFPPTLAVNQQCCGVKIMMVTYKDEVSQLPARDFRESCTQDPARTGSRDLGEVEMGPRARVVSSSQGTRWNKPKPWGYAVESIKGGKRWRRHRFREHFGKLWSEAFEAWQLDRSWYRIFNASFTLECILPTSCWLMFAISLFTLCRWRMSVICFCQISWAFLGSHLSFEL